MLFDHLQYWIFFAAVLAAVASYSAKSGRIILVLASFVFYSFWDTRFVWLLGGYTLFNYFTGLAIEAAGPLSRRAWMVLGVAGNLCVLGFFKYFNFFIDSFSHLTGFDKSSIAIKILLPVGVSFFAFEGIAYNVDVYRRDVEPKRSLIEFALFITFFPHLVAGPIIRPNNFFPQVAAGWRLTRGDFGWGMVQIIKGLIKKVVFADALALYANQYFSNPDGHQEMVFVGVTAFGLQIYFDFAGYTDIARGCARLLGFKFPPNFDRPYLSRSIAEFWKRWHISLSSWLRDYLYIPLGGSRSGKLMTYRNYMIVMGLGGLWHGASWNFVIWGVYHGLLLCGHRLWLEYSPNVLLSRVKTRIGGAFSWLLTIVLVFIGWIPFRAADWQQTKSILSGLLHTESYHLSVLPADLMVLIALASIWCLIDQRRRLEQWAEERASMLSLTTASGLALWFMNLTMVRDISIPFIYFKF
jgi:alginate O-acetyltransferase complex protein AlgI